MVDLAIVEAAEDSAAEADSEIVAVVDSEVEIAEAVVASVEEAALLQEAVDSDQIPEKFTYQITQFD